MHIKIVQADTTIEYDWTPNTQPATSADQIAHAFGTVLAGETLEGTRSMVQETIPGTEYVALNHDHVLRVVVTEPVAESNTASSVPPASTSSGGARQ